MTLFEHPSYTYNQALLQGYLQPPNTPEEIRQVIPTNHPSYFRPYASDAKSLAGQLYYPHLKQPYESILVHPPFEHKLDSLNGVFRDRSILMERQQNGEGKTDASNEKSIASLYTPHTKTQKGIDGVVDMFQKAYTGYTPPPERKISNSNALFAYPYEDAYGKNQKRGFTYKADTYPLDTPSVALPLHQHNPLPMNRVVQTPDNQIDRLQPRFNKAYQVDPEEYAYYQKYMFRHPPFFVVDKECHVKKPTSWTTLLVFVLVLYLVYLCAKALIVTK
jgi:hypothetical protein